MTVVTPEPRSAVGGRLGSSFSVSSNDACFHTLCGRILKDNRNRNGWGMSSKGSLSTRGGPLSIVASSSGVLTRSTLGAG